MGAGLRREFNSRKGAKQQYKVSLKFAVVKELRYSPLAKEKRPNKLLKLKREQYGRHSCLMVHSGPWVTLSLTFKWGWASDVVLIQIQVQASSEIKGKEVTPH
ncbi:hypothetical protein Y1Q_0010357 [Alligator mississippiensis]|uniref:Uncharacterized protein n=1 Tax=Alligator mississippiensis TaxID=8496 RepID=A0A151NN73_ALLMI|nr:hypothetical protein Y1Q_0010357 [Alligator mississippiensis]